MDILVTVLIMLLCLATEAFFSGSEIAVVSADRFIKLNPQHTSVDYAYYIKGLALFDKGKTFFNILLPRNPSDKDPAPLLTSFEVFKSLIENYPESEEDFTMYLQNRQHAEVANQS